MAFIAGVPVDNPAGGAVLVTSIIVTIPSIYKIKVTIVAEEGFWAVFFHRQSGGAERSRIMLPMASTLLGPLDLCEMYFHYGDYGEIAVREGVAQINGTVQASIELIQ